MVAPAVAAGGVVNENEADDEIFFASMRREFERYGMGMAVRWQQIYGAPRRAIAEIFKRAGVPHGTRRARRRAQKRGQL